jgi:hypothetical protein
MKTYTYACITELFAEWEIFRQKSLTKKHTFYVNNFFWKSWHLWYNREKYGRARQAIDNNIIWCMCFTCWITKATDTHSEYVISVAFPWQIGYVNASQCCIYMYITCLVYICTHLTTTYNKMYPLVNEERTVRRRTHIAYFYYAYISGPIYQLLLLSYCYFILWTTYYFNMASSYV